MDSPLTQGDIELSIANLSDLLEDAVVQLSQYANNAANAEADYKIEYARELLKVKTQMARNHQKPTVSEIEAQALVGTGDLLRERLVAEAQHSTQLERLRSLRARLDALRSLNTNLRSVV